jgi:two-component sensor histidine kinase
LADLGRLNFYPKQAMPVVSASTDRLRRLLRWGLPPGSAAAFGFAIGCVAVALAVRILFWLLKPDLVIFGTYYPAVLLATLIGGWPAGIVAQVAGGIVAWLYFDPSLAPPSQTIGEQIADFGLYGLSSGLIIWASEHYRRVVRCLDEEEHYRLLVLDELKHRLRNKHAMVLAVLRHELTSHEELGAKILDRLKALALADELLTKSDHETVDLHEILRVELSLYGQARWSARGDPLQLPPRLAATLTLVVHELATNAVKYGAFKLPGGEVSIRWRLESRTLGIEWRENGGPFVNKPERSGFGTRLFRRALDPFHGAIVTKFEPTGLRCTIRLEIPPVGTRQDPVPSLALRLRSGHARTIRASLGTAVFGAFQAASLRRTRQAGFLVLLALGLIAVVLGIENRPDLAKLPPLQKIETALGPWD